MPSSKSPSNEDPDLARAAQVPLPPSPSPSPAPTKFPDAHFTNLDEPESEKITSIPSLYLKYANENDAAVLSQWNADLDVQLIFAALFSAIVTAFAIQSLSNLQENFGETSAQLLRILVAQSISQNAGITLPPPFQVDSSSVVTNSLWLASLIISLSAALLGILCKQWLREYTAHLSPIPSIRVLQRHSRNMELEKWRVPDIIALLPVTLHVAVMLFFAGLVVYLRPINDTVAVVVTCIVGVVGIAYLVLFFLPFFSEAPFYTPMTHLVVWGLIRFLFYFLFIILFISRTVFVGIARFITLRPVRIAELLQRDIAVWRWIGRWIAASSRSPTAEYLTNSVHKEVNTELLAWLIRCPLSDDDLNEVIRLLSAMKHQKSRRMLEADGVDMMLLYHFESSCFINDGAGNIRAIPERIPQAISCLTLWSGIATSGNGIGVIYDPFLSFTAKQAVNALLQHVEGLDVMSVLGASMWWIHRDGQDERRHDVRQHLVDHVEGTTELPDDTIRILVDDPNPHVTTAPIMIQLLQKYLAREQLPAIDCIYAILLNLCNSHANYYLDRSSTSPSLIAFLLDNVEEYRTPLLHLIRSLWSVDLNSVRDRDLSKSLLGLLTRSPPLEEAPVMDVISTISFAPDSCQMKEQALVDLTLSYQHNKSGALSHKSIVAVAAFTESIFHSPHYVSCGRGLEKELFEVVNMVAEAILDAQGSPIDTDIFLPSLYTISICLKHLTTPISRTRAPSLLPQLIKSVSIPITKRQTAISQHALRVISQIVTQDISQAFALTGSISILEQLAVCDDVWIRWFSFDILKHVSYHLLQDGRKRIFGVIRHDIETRLQTTPPLVFVDHDWKNVMDAKRLAPAKSELPRVALAQEIDADIAASGIRELLEGAPESVVCSTSIYGVADFPWLYHLDTWIRLNPE